jgi:hypothetical protein
MILVVVPTWHTTHLLLGVVDLGGLLPPLPGDVVPPGGSGGIENPGGIVGELKETLRCLRGKVDPRRKS